jgi:hypothetical protein
MRLRLHVRMRAGSGRQSDAHRGTERIESSDGLRAGDRTIRTDDSNGRFERTIRTIDSPIQRGRVQRSIL